MNFTLTCYLLLLLTPAPASVLCGNNGKPTFAEPVPNVTVAVGKDVSLPCVVKNLGQYKVAWIHIDRQMIVTIHKHVISRIHRYSVTYDNAGTWLLHVTQAQQQDRGYYMCQINTNPITSQVGYLQVIVPPYFVDDDTTATSPSINVREDFNLTLKCKADGFPQPTVIWKREDDQDIILDKINKGIVVEGDMLHFQQITRIDTGAYFCVAANGVPPSISRRIFVNVQFPPMVVVPNQLTGAVVGSDITFMCQTEANPPAITYWMFNKDAMISSEHKKYTIQTIQQNDYSITMKLTIRQLEKTDFGVYHCISKNAFGETEGTIRLYEFIKLTTIPFLKPKPEITTSTTTNGQMINKQFDFNNKTNPFIDDNNEIWMDPFITNISNNMKNHNWPNNKVEMSGCYYETNGRSIGVIIGASVTLWFNNNNFWW